MKTQSLCPKCGRMYCEGFWGVGVCTADMHFSFDPTSRGDEIAGYVRYWYERNRPSWWQRRRDASMRRFGCADNFMLELISEIARVEEEAERQMKARQER